MLRLDAKGRQRVGKLKLDVSCGGEPCEAEASGKVVAKKKSGKKLRGASAAAKKKTYKLKLAWISLGGGRGADRAPEGECLPQALEGEGRGRRHRRPGNAATETLELKLRR